MITLLTHFAATCPHSDFLGFPTWYHYLNGIPDSAGNCVPQITGLNDIWLIVAAVIDILLHVAALAAIVFVIVGGVQLMTSEGQPDKVSKGRSTIINALAGLIVAISASALVSFVAGRFH